MKNKILVDTSAFIDYFRKGENSPIPQLAMSDAIVLSKIVRLELLKGVSRTERSALLNFFGGLDEIEDFAPAKLAEELLLLLHGRGLNLGIADLLILVDAKRFKVRLLTSDKQLQKAANFAKVPLVKPAMK